jgi:hypothetical protein
MYSGTTQGGRNSTAYRTGVMEFVDPGVVVIRPRGGQRGMWLAFSIAAAISLTQFVAFAVMFWRRPPENMTPALTWGILGGLLVLGLVFAILAVLARTGRIGKKLTFIDRTVGLMWKQRPGPPAPSDDAVQLRDIAELEIVSRVLGGRPPFPVFDLNLALLRPQGERLNLISCADKNDLMNDARQLAALLRVPLQDRS